MSEVKHHNQNKGKVGKKPNPYQPGKQDHFLAELRLQYGDDFVGYADVEGQFSKKNKMTSLIRSIYNGRFDLNQYGMYLIYPQIRDRLIQLSQTNYIEAFVHSTAMQMLMWNPQSVANLGIPASEVVIISNRDADLQRLWATVFEGFNSILVMNGNLSGLLNSINALRTQYCSDAKTPLSKLI